jgi:tetratricopeptide (TPR) repeat protein
MKKKSTRVWIGLGIIIIAALVVMFVLPREGDESVDEAHPASTPTPVPEPVIAQAASVQTEMETLGYIVDDEVKPGDSEPAPSAQYDRVTARSLLNLGVSLAGAGESEKAEEKFRAAIAADPTYRPPHYALAEILRQTDRFDEADREFWIADDIGLGEPIRAIVKVATQYRNRSMHERAGAILDEGRRRYPNSAEIWMHFGALLGEVGSYEDAARCLQRAIRLDPDEPLAYRNLAATQVALGDRDAALRSLREGLSRNPGQKDLEQMLSQLVGSQGG